MTKINWAANKLFFTSFCFSDASTGSRFKISREGVYDPYVLSIANLNTTDDGEYYCCLASNCSSEIEGRCENIRLYVIGGFFVLNNIQT